MQFGYCIICPCFLIGLGLVCKLDQIRVLARHHCISIRTGFHMKRTLYPARNKGEGITRGLEDITFLYHCCPSRTCHWLFNCEIYSALVSIIYPDRFIRWQCHIHIGTTNISVIWKNHPCWGRHVTGKGVASPARLIGVLFWNPRRQDSTNCVWWIPVTSAVHHSGSSDWPWMHTIWFDHQDTGIPM